MDFVWTRDESNVVDMPIHYMYTLLILNITCLTFGKNQNRNRRTLSKQVEFHADRLELVGKVRDLTIPINSSQMWQFNQDIAEMNA